MISRRTFLVTVAGSVVIAPRAAGAQPTGKVARVGILGHGDPPRQQRAGMLTQHFFPRLQDLGWIEGQNLIVEVRHSEGRPERLPELAAELVRLKVDVIFVLGTLAAVAARQVTGTTPIVMARVFDPVKSGLIISLAHPGGNVTGLSGIGPDSVAKHLEILKEVAPHISRVTSIIDSTNPSHVLYEKEFDERAKALRMRHQRIGIGMVADLDRHDGTPEAACTGSNCVASEQRPTSPHPKVWRVCCEEPTAYDYWRPELCATRPPPVLGGEHG